MQTPWSPDFEVDAEQARQLIAGVASHLADVEPVRVAAGWDNVVYEVGDWLFRFPRRQIAVELLDVELAVLPALADLPLPVPSPAIVGEATSDYPSRFYGYRRLEGAPACRHASPLGTDAGGALGAFVRALHDTPAPPQTPGDVIGRADLAARADTVITGLDDLETGGLATVEPRHRDIVSSAATTVPEGSTLCHGDLYGCHVLVDGGDVVGVIDWGDVHVGDPALDVSIAYSLLSGEARASFFAEYGEPSATTELRARSRAVHYGALLTRYGTEIGDTDIAAAGRLALDLAIV